MQRNSTTDTKKKADGVSVDIRAARAAAIQSRYGSLHAFIIESGYSVPTAWAALRGTRSGPTSQIILAHIKREFGL